jgi:CheY-like chemotaxis protein
MKQVSILLVEDYPDTRALMQMLLESAGYAVTAKEDGAEALESLAESVPDLILTDLMMPRVSGIELIQRVRSNSKFAGTPIIAMTAYSSGPVDQAKAAGANAILKKPIDIETMSSTIKSVIPACA